MWKYIKRYLHFAVIAALFMIGEVLMDLVQPGIMSKIVDDGVLGINNDGIGDLQIIWRLGVQMICPRPVRRLLRFDEQRICPSIGTKHRK